MPRTQIQTIAGSGAAFGGMTGRNVDVGAASGGDRSPAERRRPSWIPDGDHDGEPSHVQERVTRVSRRAWSQAGQGAIVTTSPIL